MRGKYEFLISLKLLEYEISELMGYSKEHCQCFELLKNKLDYLCEFMNYDENLKCWNLWGENEDILEWIERLRETSVKALCDVEKYQSACACNKGLNVGKYIDMLYDSVKYEFDNFKIDSNSKVLFIGSGAFPISAITIAKEIGAQVMCLDIDDEALKLGQNVAVASGVGDKINFVNKKLSELDFIKETTHIIIASLVKNKYEVLRDLRDNVNFNTKIILRYGNGLKSIFNYPLEEDLSKNWIKTTVSQNKDIYDTVVLEKPKYECS